MAQWNFGIGRRLFDNQLRDLGGVPQDRTAWDTDVTQFPITACNWSALYLADQDIVTGHTPGWTPASITNVRSWLRADLGVTFVGGNTIQTWADQIAGDSNRNMSNGSGAVVQNAINVSFNNQATVDFLSSGDFMFSGAWAKKPPTHMTILYVANSNIPAASNYYVCDTLPGDNDAVIIYFGSGAGAIQHSAGAAATIGTAPLNSNAVSAGSTYAGAFCVNGYRDSKVYIAQTGINTAEVVGNGAIDTAGEGRGGRPVDISGFTLGNYRGHGAGFELQGSIAEFVVVEGELSAQDLFDWFYYCNARYSTVFSAPALMWGNKAVSYDRRGYHMKVRLGAAPTATTSPSGKAAYAFVSANTQYVDTWAGGAPFAEGDRVFDHVVADFQTWAVFRADAFTANNTGTVTLFGAGFVHGSASSNYQECEYSLSGVPKWGVGSYDGTVTERDIVYGISGSTWYLSAFRIMRDNTERAYFGIQGATIAETSVALVSGPYNGLNGFQRLIGYGADMTMAAQGLALGTWSDRRRKDVENYFNQVYLVAPAVGSSFDPFGTLGFWGM